MLAGGERRARATRRSALATALALPGGAAGAGLAACAPGAAPPPGDPGAPAGAGPTTVSFSFWGSQERADLVAREVVPLFRARYPQIEVELLHNPAQHKQKLVTMFAAGTLPDVPAIDNYDIAEFSAQGVLLDLGPLLSRHRFRLDQYFEAALLEGVYQGKRFGLPYIGSARVLFFNKDLFAKAGLRTPHELHRAGQWTQDAFLDAAQKLTVQLPDGRTQFGYDFGPSLQFTGEHVWDLGGEILDKDRRRCLLDSPNAVAAYGYLQDLIHKQRIVPAAQDRQGANLPRDGRLAMEEIWRGAVPERRTWGFAWDVAPRPRGKAGQLTLYKGNSVAVARATRAPEAAWAALTFMTGPEADRVWVRDGGATPLKTNVDLFLANRPPDNNAPWMDAYAYARLLPFTPAWAEMDRLFTEELAGVWQNTRAPRDALGALVPRIDAALAALPR